MGVCRNEGERMNYLKIIRIEKWFKNFVKEDFLLSNFHYEIKPHSQEIRMLLFVVVIL